MVSVETIEFQRLSIPLTRPYTLSHKTIDAFDVILATIRFSDGSTGLGETTTLEGYSKESAEESWSRIQGAGRELVGRPRADIPRVLDQTLGDVPFTRTSLACAAETAHGEPFTDLAVPIVGIISTAEQTDVALSLLREQISLGYRTIKLKIGFEPMADAKAVAEIVSNAPPNIQFRVDANQAYDLGAARVFLSSVPLDRLQVVEQPLPVGLLEEHAKLSSEFPVDIMLDEEVHSRDDLYEIEAAEAASAVKFKLMKHGSIDRTSRLIDEAVDLGFDVVIGNGVQSDIGCLYEASIWSRQEISLAGEFNGWLKQRHRLLAAGPTFSSGRLKWGGGAIRLDKSLVERYSTDSIVKSVER